MRLLGAERIDMNALEDVAENEEQTRLLSISGQREAALLARLAECRRERDDLQEKCNVFQDKTWSMREEINRLRKALK